MSTFFDDLLESVQQMDEIIKGEPVPSCDSHVGAIQAKEICKATGLVTPPLLSESALRSPHYVTGSKVDANPLAQPRRS